MKFGSRLLTVICLACLLAACGNNKEDANLAAIVAISLTQTAAAPPQSAPTLTAPPATAPTGVISGSVHLTAPPTPHMTVYALEINTGKWASTETAPAESSAAYKMVVPPGSYQVFGFTDNNAFVGYSVDGSGLTIVNVAANQTVADVPIGPPGQFECGATFGVPASPDNRFKAVPSPSQSCIATAQAANTAAANQPNEAQRIQFAPGAASTRLQESIPPSESGRRFVLKAMQGQQMTINLSAPGNPSYAPFYFVLQGADWSVFVSPDQRYTQWTGQLPLTQDYYIDVVSTAKTPIDCILDIAIGALVPKPVDVASYPRIIPPGFESLSGLSANVLLPAEFPVVEGVPDVVPYILWNEGGSYDISLDYGVDCRGAGACHYGSLSGLKVYSADLVSTPNFVYDSGSVKQVSLIKDIAGYYIEGQCGASCDDSRVFWQYNGYQYIAGLKGAAKKAVLEFANEVIANSLP